MPAFGKHAMLPVMLVATFAAAAGAQQKPQCEIDEGTPGQIARATLDLNLATTATKPEDAAAKLRDAIKLINDADKTKNPLGHNLVYGKTLVLWMMQPNVGSLASRGTLGFTTDTAAKVDLAASIDSAFKTVETAHPECVSMLNSWRQQKGWVDLVNAAIEQANADHPDSAEVLAKRANVLYSGAPYGYMVLAQAAVKRNQPKVAIDYYKQTIAAAKDTTFADVRRQMLNTLGNLAADAAEQATGADKTSYLAEAKAAYEQLSKDSGKQSYADAARGGLARVATLAGDTTALKASYSEQLANPTAYPYTTVMQAAVSAARANQTADAEKLFEAAYAMNPYHRDVLYNLGRLYVLDSNYTRAIPIIRTLTQVDPANADNYRLLTIAYSGLSKWYANHAKGTKVPAQIRAYNDSVRATVDSALYYNQIADSLPARLAFNEFTPGDAKTTVGGIITNATNAAQTYDLSVEFLDKTGKVVSKADTTVGPVPPNADASFQISGAGAGIVAFRYAPIAKLPVVKMGATAVESEQAEAAKAAAKPAKAPAKKKKP